MYLIILYPVRILKTTKKIPGPIGRPDFRRRRKNTMDTHTTDYRREKDSIGVKDVPEDVYYGVQSLRAAENFPITGLNMHPEIINSLAYIKKAAAITNCEIGILDKKRATAIVQACDEIIAGKFHDDFISRNN